MEANSEEQEEEEGESIIGSNGEETLCYLCRINYEIMNLVNMAKPSREQSQ